jgi:hypothetical protein
MQYLFASNEVLKNKAGRDDCRLLCFFHRKNAPAGAFFFVVWRSAAIIDA